VSEEQPVNTWKLFMKQKTRRHWSMGLRYRTACCGKFAAACRSNRAQLDFSGMGRAATYGTNAYLFFPLAFETMGPINGAGQDFISELGHRISDLTEDPRETSFLFQRISVALQRLSTKGDFGRPHREIKAETADRHSYQIVTSIRSALALLIVRPAVWNATLLFIWHLLTYVKNSITDNNN
jgi:hypothetical protein